MHGVKEWFDMGIGMIRELRKSNTALLKQMQSTPTADDVNKALGEAKDDLSRMM